MPPFPDSPYWWWRLQVRLRGWPDSPPDEQLLCHIDEARSADGRQVLLHGWAEGADTSTLYWFDGSPAAKPVRLNTVPETREDVQAHILSAGRPATTGLHGFWATIPLAGEGLTGARLCRVRKGVTCWSEELTVSVERMPLPSLLGYAMAAARRSGRELTEEFLRLAGPLVATPPPPPRVSDRREIVPAVRTAGEAPRASIVVPFYGEDFFLVDHLMAQARAPHDVEWVFVCDDPRLSGTLSRTLDEYRHIVRQPTTLLTLDANGGFAHANNIGAAHARGTYVLLMNSDVYCDDFAFLERAMSHMEADPTIGCIGFSMQFEDGTVQHDGMAFQRVPWFEGRWASEHPRKGLPAAPWQLEPPIEAEAVTAALMLLRREDFPAGHVFDSGYVVGDFEDGDLCLRLREQGRSVRLLRAPGLWHLERQSLRRAADAEARFATTFLNCLRFNERWASTLHRAARVTS